MVEQLKNKILYKAGEKRYIGCESLLCLAR